MIVTLVDSAKAKILGILAGARINVARATEAVEDSKLTLMMIRDEIVATQKKKQSTMKRLEALSSKAGRRYTRELHRLDKAVVYLKDLQEDRETARYLLDRARLSKRKCEAVLALFEQ